MKLRKHLEIICKDSPSIGQKTFVKKFIANFIPFEDHGRAIQVVWNYLKISSVSCIRTRVKSITTAF